MKITQDQVKEYFDNIPAYRFNDELNEIFGAKVVSSKIVEELEDRIEDLEEELEGY